MDNNSSSHQSSYPDSNSSSPLSRDLDSDAPPDYKVKFMCSYGGKIQPRSHDNTLSYVGGDTKILSLDRSTSFSSLLPKLSSLSHSPPSSPVCFKYQLPGEDLDALISVTNDDDLEHLMSEYDRLNRSSPKPARLRIFLFPVHSKPNSDEYQLKEEPNSEGSWFVDALNSVQYNNQPVDTNLSAPPTPPPPTSEASNPDFLFGFDATVKHKEEDALSDSVASVQSQMERSRIADDGGMQKSYQDQANSYAHAAQLYNNLPEKVPVAAASHAAPVTMSAGYYQVASGMAGDQQPFYVFHTPAAGVYHQNQNPAVRQVTGAPAATGQAYYSVQSAYNAPPSVVNSSVRQAAAGMVTEQGYAQVGYDHAGRQVYYTMAGGGLAPPPPQYQMVATPGGAVVDGRAVGMGVDGVKATQTLPHGPHV